MPVPLIDLGRQHAALLPAMTAVFERIARTGRAVLGPDVEHFESELARFCGARHAVALTSGTDALLVSLMALNIGPGDEVITSPFTFFATAGVIARVGAMPKFVDIDPASYNIDPSLIESAITPRTRALMPVHLFGQTAAMGAINQIARRRQLAVIEDAAQATGAREGDRRAGALSDVGCLSFYPTKNLAALGDAGACVTDDENLARRIAALRVHGQDSEYQHTRIGGNFRIDALQAALLSIKLPLLDGWARARQRLADRYREAFVGLPLCTPIARPATQHVYNPYTLRVPDGRREALRQHLAQRGIGVRVYYPLPLHLQPCFAYLGGRAGDFPHAERAAGEVLSLPMFAELTDDEQDQVILAVREFFHG